MSRKIFKKTFISIFVCLFILITSSAGTFAQSNSSNITKGGFMEGLMGKVIKDSGTSYTISVNNAQFNGEVFTENLSIYFAEHDKKAYTYEISSGNPKNADITLDAETGILTVIPHKRTIEKIVVSATEGGEQPINIEFKLKIIDAVGYATEKILLITLIVFVLLILVGFFFHKSPKFVGEVIVDSIPITSLEKLTAKNGCVKIPRRFKVNGYIYSDGEEMKFVSNKIFYYKVKNTVNKAFSVKISVNKQLSIYTDEDCKKGIRITYLQ